MSRRRSLRRCCSGVDAAVIGRVGSRRSRPTALDLMQLARQGRNCLVDQRGATPLVEGGGDDLTGGRYRDIDGDGADLGQRLRLFLRDPLLCQKLPAAQHFLEIAQRLCGDPLRFFLGMSDDHLGLGRPFLLSALIGGERLLRLFAQAARRVELLPDALGARINRADDRSLPRLPDSDYKDHDGEEDPELRIGEDMRHQAARSDKARSTAAARFSGSAAEPVTFSVTDRATSTAISCMSESARCFAAAIWRSASAVCRASASPSCRCRAAASAAMRSVVSLTAAWASAR